MNIRRSALAVAVSAVTIVALTGCIRLPFLPNGSSDDSSGGGSVVASSDVGGATTEQAIVGTTWGGTDSDGDQWEITFQDGGGIAFTYEGSSYDDDSDTWVLVAQDLTITIEFDEGTAIMTGPFVDAKTTISLDGHEGGAVWHLDLEPV